MAYRRDAPLDSPEVAVLRHALVTGENVVTTGVVLMELLRGFVPPRVQRTILAEVAGLPFIEPSLNDHVGAANRSNMCRRDGVQLPSTDNRTLALGVVRAKRRLDAAAVAEHIARMDAQEHAYRLPITSTKKLEQRTSLLLPQV